MRRHYRWYGHKRAKETQRPHSAAAPPSLLFKRLMFDMAVETLHSELRDMQLARGFGSCLGRDREALCMTSPIHTRTTSLLCALSFAENHTPLPTRFASLPPTNPPPFTIPRADLWSTGVILYEMLFGRAPFHSQTYPELISKIMSPEPVRLPAAPPLTPQVRHLLTVSDGRAASEAV
jgi:serine/threonine protein kinase